MGCLVLTLFQVMTLLTVRPKACVKFCTIRPRKNTSRAFSCKLTLCFQTSWWWVQRSAIAGMIIVESFTQAYFWICQNLRESQFTISNLKTRMISQICPCRLIWYFIIGCHDQKTKRYILELLQLLPHGGGECQGWWTSGWWTSYIHTDMISVKYATDISSVKHTAEKGWQIQWTAVLCIAQCSVIECFMYL